MIYGSAKRGLEFYCEALRHLLADTGCRVQFYRLGFVRTSMLEGRPPPLPFVRPETVAKAIIRNLGHDRSIYVPGWWALVAVVLTLIPWRIFKKLDI